jgi:signal transduction histidine kinase
MPARSLSSPRRVAATFFGLVLAPSILLVGLGWRLFEQDRAGALQQLQDRRRQTADLAVVAIEQALAGTEQSLRDPASLDRLVSSGDAVIIVGDSSRPRMTVRGRLAFTPRPDPGRGVKAEPFAAADQLWNKGNAEAARARYRELATARDETVRAGALLRLTWKASPSVKLDTLRELASIESVSIEGAPVALLAGIERCRVLAELGRTAELRSAATSLRNDLVAGRWSISRRVYEANLHDVNAWLGIGPGGQSATNAELLASAIESWWQSATDRQARSGRRHNADTGVTTVWVSEGERHVLLAALPAFVDREWLTAAKALADSQNTGLLQRDPGARGGGVDEERRSAAETGLPWTIAVTDADAGAEIARLAGRRSLWLAGLATLVILLGAGGYLVTRSIGRELAVARLQSDFVAAVSHEFRTPLTSLRQLTEVLVDERVTTDDRRAAYYRALARQTERLHRLVESLLDLGRLEAGTSPYRLAPLDACALVRSVADEFERESTGRGVRIDLEVNGDAWQVAGDRDALTNALWNLLDNAVKYSPDSPTVWVSVEQEASRLLIRVRDQGIGIPASEQRVIFDKFVRGARARADGFKGTGIGLAMVRHIVKAHGGEVEVQSTPGQGSTFTLALPLAKVEVHSPKLEVVG